MRIHLKCQEETERGNQETQVVTPEINDSSQAQVEAEVAPEAVDEALVNAAAARKDIMEEQGSPHVTPNNPLGNDSDLKKVIHSLFSPDNDNNMSGIIAQEVVKALVKKQKQTKDHSYEVTSCFLETQNEFVCSACVEFSRHPSFPSHKKHLNSGNLGIYRKAALTHQKSMKEHVNSSVHRICTGLKRAEEKRREATKLDSQRACEIMVVNVIFSLKELGGGASLFRRLMNKDCLNPQLVCPSKNDGVQWFFRLRDIVYKNLEACIHQIANEAHTISISLDKVTIASRSYTVLTTFLFYHGQIYEFLNELFIMDLGKRKLNFSILGIREEMQGCESCISNLSTKPFIDCLLLSGGFDSEGTARLVVASLKKTLGMTEEDLQYIVAFIEFSLSYLRGPVD